MLHSSTHHTWLQRMPNSWLFVNIVNKGLNYHNTLSAIKFSAQLRHTRVDTVKERS